MIDVGSKVVCIISSWQPDSGLLGILVPKENHVYTVREIIDWYYDRWVGILLHEIHNGNDPSGGHGIGPGEPCFNIKAFRPLEKRQTSIDVFTKILDNVPTQLEPV